MSKSFNEVLKEMREFQQRREHEFNEQQKKENDFPEIIAVKLPPEWAEKLDFIKENPIPKKEYKRNLIDEPFSSFIHKSETNIVKELNKHNIGEVIQVLRIMETRENETPEHKRITQITRNYIEGNF